MLFRLAGGFGKSAKNITDNRVLAAFLDPCMAGWKVVFVDVEFNETGALTARDVQIPLSYKYEATSIALLFKLVLLY